MAKKKDITPEVVKKMTGLLLNKQYLRRRGMICPRCQDMYTLDPADEDDRGRGRVQFEEGATMAEREIECEACGFRFLDLYKLVGYKEIE